MKGLCFPASKQVHAITLLAAVFSTLSLAQPSSAQQQTSPATPRPLITQPVNESQLTVLKGNTHPLARPQFDLGTAPATLPMQRMLLVLKRSPQQESALDKLLNDQQDKSSPNYHKWLTPEEFGKQFGPTDADVQTITAWLQSHGFQVGSTKGRATLEFSGSASQVQEAFHTTIHKYMVNEEQHWANSGDPSIPTALTPAVAGVATLHNFLKKPQIQMSKQNIYGKVRPGKLPLMNFSNGIHGLAPADYQTIYNFTSLYSYSVNGGAGATIGIVGRSNLYYGSFGSGQDIEEFRDIFIPCCDGVGSFQVIVDGPDPGDLGGAEEAEATLDTSWSGAVAPAANIQLVVSATTNTTDGVDLSELYIVESNLADIMSESFGSCEYFNTDAEVAFITGVAEQAAAQGITYFVSTGDNGAEGCDDPSSAAATGPISVNLLASTPFNVAVGGTMFNENGQDDKYWNSTNNSVSFSSALSYIPEDVWNESCASSACGAEANLAAGSGGASSGNPGSGGTFAGFPKPAWQTAVTGIPDDGVRDLPDVSLTAAGHDPYVLCLEGSCVTNSQGEYYIYLVSGTSASTPAFAGIMAYVDVQMALLNPGQGRSIRQGQANYTLYRLAASQNAHLSQCNGSNLNALPGSACIFNDITAGNNAVPGEPNYGLSDALYQAGVGYDQASGLGSVNVANLVASWNSVTYSPTSTALTLNNSSSITITHGQSVSVNIAVTPNSASGLPTGDVSLVANTSLGFGSFTLNAGSVNSSTNQLVGGSYQVSAHYAGDGTYAPSDSGFVGVQVSAENSTTTLSGPFTLSSLGQYTVPFATAPFGSAVFVRADVAGTSGHGSPSGPVTFTSSSGSIPNGSSTTLNSDGNASIQSNPLLVNGPNIPFDAGQYAISASYGGDSSFNPSASMQSAAFTIQPGFFAAVQSVVLISAPGSSGSTSVSVTSSTGFSGTISLSCSALPAGASCQFSPSSITAGGTLATASSTITVTTMAATALLRSPRRPYLAHLLAAGSFLFFSIILVGSSRRRCSLQVLTPLLLLIMLVPACGGGSGGGGNTNQGPPPNSGTPAGTYNVVVTAASGSTNSNTGFTLVVQ